MTPVHLGDDRWKVWVYVGKGPDGKHHQKTRQFRAKNLREARKIGESVRGELRKVAEQDKAHAHTVAGLAEQWLKLCRNNGLSPSTIVSYELVTRMIVGRFGKRAAVSITARDVDRWYSDLIEAGSSPANVHAYHRVLRAMMRQAELWDMVIADPTRKASPPKVPKVKHQIPTNDALAAVIDAAGIEMRTVLHVLCATGCRRGELVALRWEDLEGDIIQIRRSQLDVKGSRGKVKSTKTDEERTIDLDPVTVAALDGWRVEHARRSEQLGVAPAAWMFPAWETGGVGPYRPSWLSHRWAALRVKHGLTARLHDTRHWHASTLIAAGVPVVQVSKRLGHAQVSTTQNIYAHLIPNERGRSASVIQAALGPG